MFTVDYRVAEYFFDRARVINAIAKAERDALSKAGAFVRTRARTSIRESFGRKAGQDKRGRRQKARPAKTAAPGNPPYSHSRSRVVSLRNILFAYIPGSHSVFIGPVGLNSRLKHSSATTVPELMEFGGTAAIWKYVGTHGKRVRRRVPARYAPHPFMGPALAREVAAGTIPDAFRGRVQ